MALLRSLYAITIFLSAFLLFVVEPMAAKQLLPTLGGSSAVWTTCLVFFSVALLLGYLYAHWISSRFKPIQQALIHIVLLTAALLTLGMHVSPGPWAVSYHPALTVFRVLATVIGLPYLVLSATTMPAISRAPRPIGCLPFPTWLRCWPWAVIRYSSSRA
jgi:hypothetical protein